MALTPKQEKFCALYVELGNASEAYRQAYDAGGMSVNTVKVKASEMLKKGNIAVTVELLKNNAAKRHEITVDDLIRELDENRKVALEADTPQSSAATAATMAKAKLLGLVVDKSVNTLNGEVAHSIKVVFDD